MKRFFMLAAVILFCAPWASGADRSYSFPYGGREFGAFVSESCRYTATSTTSAFYSVMERGYRTHLKRPQRNLGEYLDAHRRSLSRGLPADVKARMEMRMGTVLHRFVKKSIPTFSLDRGFEFAYTAANGERQCFLQSVLLAGMLRRAGVNAGVAMICRNQKGEETNNGHAVTLLKLSSGADIILDASEKTPWHQHRGLFVRCPDYKYVTPIFVPGKAEISGYVTGAGLRLPARKAQPLDLPFVQSQFWYYRGERSPDGVLAEKPTAEGLRSSLRALLVSRARCPSNPLTAYMICKTHLMLGHGRLAEESAVGARRLYTSFGWMPRGLAEKKGARE